jgi:hypothetical protein
MINGAGVTQRRDYQAALRADTAARRLLVMARIFMVLVGVVAATAVGFAIYWLVIADTALQRWACAIVAGGAIAWTVAGLLVGFWATTYARDVQARAPWQGLEY